MNNLYIPAILLASLFMSSKAEAKSTRETFLLKSEIQDKSRKEVRGDKYFFIYSYDKAIESYADARSLSLEGQRRLAESYAKMGLNAEAEIVYSKVVASAEVVSEDYYNYSMILKSNAKYSEANSAMNRFSILRPNDLRSQDFNAHKAELPELLKDNGNFRVLHLDANSSAQDFGTTYYKNSIVFASSRSKAKMLKRTYNGNGKPFLNMYISEVKDGQLQKPVNFDKSINTKMHDGPASFNADGTYMAFTKNNGKDKSRDKIVELQIYFRTYKDGEWSKPEPFFLNNDAYSVGHPCLTADGKTLYFTSNKPGGFGKADLYKVTKDAQGQWGQMENLGDKVNTEGDELFPFLEENSGTFFFSSNGRFGIGGQDIFMASLKNSGFENVHNAGSPLNTPNDDFAAIADGKTNKGYFSSNRTGGSGDDDIYSVDFLKKLEIRKRIEGIAKDVNGNAIPATFITFQDENGNALDTLTTKADASYSFAANTDKNFKLIGKREGYKEGEITANTFGNEQVVKADVTLLLNQEIVAAKVEKAPITEKNNTIKKDENRTDLVKTGKLKSIYFDLDKYNIRADAVAELDKVVKLMNSNPSMIVEISAYTDCRETREYNMDLSDKRATSSASYIKERITKPERISGIGYGESKLVNGCSCEGDVVSECSEYEHQKNRRIEFMIIKPSTAKN